MSTCCFEGPAGVVPCHEVQRPPIGQQFGDSISSLCCRAGVRGPEDDAAGCGDEAFDDVRIVSAVEPLQA
jgi:hypothetical protein